MEGLAETRRSRLCSAEAWHERASQLIEAIPDIAHAGQQHQQGNEDQDGVDIAFRGLIVCHDRDSRQSSQLGEHDRDGENNLDAASKNRVALTDGQVTLF